MPYIMKSAVKTLLFGNSNNSKGTPDMRTGLNTLSGHSFRIRGTMHLLLLGVDPFIVMAQGRWQSTAFLEYWQLCEEIIPTFIGFSMSSQSSLLSTMALFKQHLISA